MISIRPDPWGVPADLTTPTRGYKRSPWLAFANLLGFVALYVGLTTYFGWLAYRLLCDALNGGGGIVGALLAIPPLLFFFFLVGGLFVVKEQNDPTLLEVREEDEPALFAFVRRIADDTGAPRPHRVFLSARVNAAVFYDLSFRNLLFPSKKNLEIGLGLVNALSLDEIKAVIAHELGHFAQRTMAIGRWVYTAQQIAGHIVPARGWLDKVLAWCRPSICASPGSDGSCGSSSGRSGRCSTPRFASSSSPTARSAGRWSCRPIWSRSRSPGATA